MNSILSIALSGMQAATRRLEISASNVANANTDGALPDSQGNYPADAPRAYAPRRVDQVEVAGGGTRAVVSNASPAYVPVYDPQAPYANQDGMVAAPNVDLAEEAVQQMIARYTFAANVMVMKTYDRMMKTLFDIKA